MTLFLIVNGVFIAVFIALAIIQPPWWSWVLFVAAWIIIELFVARDLHLAKWHWVLLIAILTAIDVGVLYGTGQL